MKRERPKPNLDFLSELVIQRNDTQNILFELLRLVVDHREIAGDLEINSIFQLTVGAAFSLWRAIVLADRPFEPFGALSDAKELLNRVVSFNAVLFPDEKETRQWMGGYYVSNIEFRLKNISDTYGAILNIKELTQFTDKWNPIAFPPPLISGPDFFRATIAVLQKIVSRLRELSEPS